MLTRRPSSFRRTALPREYDQYEREEEAKLYASDDDLLAQLDPYGDLTYTVGDEDWLAAMDFVVDVNPDGDIKVAYMVVVDSESGGFTDTVEKKVVSADKAPFNLPSYWLDIWAEQGHHDEELYEAMAENEQTNTRWNADLKRALAEAGYKPPKPAPRRRAPAKSRVRKPRR